jgi:pimeloyl-ACP methyl ester carboxylesterase
MADNVTGRFTGRSVVRKAGRMILVVISILLAGFLVLVGVLALRSPGRPNPILGEDGKPLAGSISEKIFVKINGVEQGMFIQSKDAANPVLLLLHGGPGMPEFFLTQKYPTGLEDDFTVVWWEQRGAGLSYDASLPQETITAGQLVSDTLQVTNYLRSRFGQDKIYLMGHSWGSFIGIQAAARAPELYHAYIGVGQVANQLESEKLAYDTMLEQAIASGNEKMLRKLEAAPPTMTVPLPDAYMALRDTAMHALGVGTTRDMKSVVTGIFVPSWLSPVYTLSEKLHLWRGKWSPYSRSMWNQMLPVDMTAEIPQLDIPIYLMHGKYDYTVAYPLTKSYFQQLKAPLKGFYTFENSAHSPFFEEPERFRMILKQDVLGGGIEHSDPTGD